MEIKLKTMNDDIFLIDYRIQFIFAKLPRFSQCTSVYNLVLYCFRIANADVF